MADLIPLDEILAEAAALFDEGEDGKAFLFLKAELGPTLRDQSLKFWLQGDDRFKRFLNRYGKAIIETSMKQD